MPGSEKVQSEKNFPEEKGRAERPHEIWGIDMTKFLVAGLGWVYLVIVIDWYTKKIVG